jgi:hypothetical protein
MDLRIGGRAPCRLARWEQAVALGKACKFRLIVRTPDEAGNTAVFSFQSPASATLKTGFVENPRGGHQVMDGLSCSLCPHVGHFVHRDNRSANARARAGSLRRPNSKERRWMPRPVKFNARPRHSTKSRNPPEDTANHSGGRLRRQRPGDSKNWTGPDARLNEWRLGIRAGRRDTNGRRRRIAEQTGGEHFVVPDATPPF